MMSVPSSPLELKHSSLQEREALQPKRDVEIVITNCKGGKVAGKPRNEKVPTSSPDDDPAEDDEVIPPDGGWGWLVTFGSFINMALLGILVSTYGIVYASMFKEFEITSSTASWIFNINQFLWNASAMLGGPLISNFGWRKVSIIGGVFISVATVVNAFIPNPNYLFLTYSFLTGLGQGLIAIVSFVTVPHYFDSKRGFAVGITASGICVGQFSGPLIATYLLEQYGYSGSMLILGGISLHTIVASSLYHPVEWHAKKPSTRGTSHPTITVHRVSESHDSDTCLNLYLPNGISRQPSLTFELYKERRRNSSISSMRRLSSALELGSSLYFGNLGLDTSKDSSVSERGTTPQEYSGFKKFIHVLKLVAKNVLLFKWFRVQILAITISLAISTYINFLMLVPFAMSDAGHSMEMVSNSLAVAGVCNMITRLLVTTLTDFVPFSCKYFFMGGVFGIFVSINCFTFVSKPMLIFTVMTIFGISVGSCGCLLSLIVLEFMGFEYLPQVLGLDGLSISVTFLIFGPAVGYIRDLTMSYVLTLRILSLAPLISFCLWFFMPCAVALDKKREALSHEKYYDDDN